MRLVAGWLEEAGLTVAYDTFGNMFGSTDDNAAGASPSLSGSHLDTVRAGGRYDGTLGVVAAVEAVHAIRAVGLPPRPLEVVVWRCEEPVRFSQGKVGSLLFAGTVTEADLRPLEEPPLDLAAELAEDRFGPRRAPSRGVASVVELHIEQGARLERAGRRLGVVTAVAAPVRLTVAFAGRADHSGATPMGARLDALCGASELVLAIEEEAVAESVHETVATAADVDCEPATLNVVPGRATVYVDVRGIDAASMERVRAAIAARAGAIAAARGLGVEVELMSAGTPTVLRPGVVARVEAAVRAAGFDPMLLPSGAGHDAQCLNERADAAMLFVPSVGGISHSRDEMTLPEDVEAGARALAAAWLDLASGG